VKGPHPADNDKLWRLFRLRPEDRELVRKMADAADLSCEAVCGLLYRMACELVRTDLFQHERDVQQSE